MTSEDFAQAAAPVEPVLQAFSIDYYPEPQIVRMPDGSDLAVAGTFTRYTGRGKEEITSSREVIEAELQKAVASGDFIEISAEQPDTPLRIEGRTKYFIAPNALQWIQTHGDTYHRNINLFLRDGNACLTIGFRNFPYKEEMAGRDTTMAKALADRCGLVGLCGTDRSIYDRPEAFKLDKLTRSGRSVSSYTEHRHTGGGGDGRGGSIVFATRAEAKQALADLISAIEMARREPQRRPAGIAPRFP